MRPLRVASSIRARFPHPPSRVFHGSIAALVTPMNPEGQIDLAAWDQLLDWHAASGTDGVVVGGTTGESQVLGEKEYSRLLSRAKERLSGRVSVLAGTGSADTDGTIERTRLAESLGADGALVVTPFYNRPPQRGLLRHFQAVAEASGIPVVLYNVPGRTGVDMLPETVAELAEHERIVAVKEAVGDEARVKKLLETCKGRIDILSGDDPTACRSMSLGAHGVISVAANVVPRRFKAMCEAALANDVDRAESLRKQLQPLFDFLGAESNPIPAKWILWRLGRIGPGIRLPLVSLHERHHGPGNQLIEKLKLEKG